MVSRKSGKMELSQALASAGQWIDKSLVGIQSAYTMNYKSNLTATTGEALQ